MAVTMNQWLDDQVQAILKAKQVWNPTEGGIPLRMMNKIRGIMNQGVERFGASFYDKFREADIAAKLVSKSRGAKKSLVRQVAQLFKIESLNKGRTPYEQAVGRVTDIGRGVVGGAGSGIPNVRVSPGQALVRQQAAGVGGMVPQAGAGGKAAVAAGSNKLLGTVGWAAMLAMMGTQAAKDVSADMLGEKEAGIQGRAMDQMMAAESPDDAFYQAMLPMATQRAGSSYQAVLQQLLGGRSGPRLATGEMEIGG